jgi:hypothetical protein
MKSELTDISYSTALTYELVTQYGLLTLGAPTLPSLRKEAIYRTDPPSKAVLLFLQYRLSEHNIGSASSLKEYWGTPYYRFTVQQKHKSKLHDLLLGLEATNSLVYYVAPEFHTKGRLFESLMQTTLLSNSTFWSPRQIGALANAQRNTVSYKPGTEFGVLEPERKTLERVIGGEALVSVIKARIEANWAETYDDDRFLRLGDHMLDNCLKLRLAPRERRLANDIRAGRGRIDSRDYLSLISMLLYDCYVYLATT